MSGDCSIVRRFDSPKVTYPARSRVRVRASVSCRTIVLSRLIYASPAWSGFTTAEDRQRVEAFLRRSKRCGFCPLDLPDFDELLEDADDQLFQRILNNPHHTLHQLLPPQSTASQHYQLRHRTHDRQLPAHKG